MVKYYNNMIMAEIEKTINNANKITDLKNGIDQCDDLVDRINNSTALSICFNDIFSNILNGAKGIAKDRLKDEYYNNIFTGIMPVFGIVIQRLGYRFVKEIKSDNIYLNLKGNNNDIIQMERYTTLPHFESFISNIKEDKNEILTSLQFNTRTELEEFEYNINGFFLIIINNIVDSIKEQIYSNLGTEDVFCYNDFEHSEASQLNELF